MNTTSFAARALAVTALGMLLVSSALAEDGEYNGRKEKYLYVWAGDQAHRAPTFSPLSTLMKNLITMATLLRQFHCLLREISATSPIIAI